MEKFILKNEAGQPVFIQQKGKLTKPTVRLTPTTFQWIKMLAGMANISMGSIVEQCVAYAITNMAAVDENEEVDR